MTIVALGRMVSIAEKAAAKLPSSGIECTILDPETTSPLDEETILDSWSAITGRSGDRRSSPTPDAAWPPTSPPSSRTRLQGSDRPNSSGDPAAHAGAICANARGRILPSESRSCRGGRPEKVMEDVMVSERVRSLTMPRWGMTMTEGKLVGWLAADGQAIEPGKDLLEIESHQDHQCRGRTSGGCHATAAGQRGRHRPCRHASRRHCRYRGIRQRDRRFRRDSARGGGCFCRTDGASGPLPRAIAASGHLINVLSSGSGDAMPLILIHGFGGDLNSWMFNQPELSIDRPVHAIDLPGHGNSGLEMESGSVPDLARAYGSDGCPCDRACASRRPFAWWFRCAVSRHQASAACRVGPAGCTGGTGPRDQHGVHRRADHG